MPDNKALVFVLTPIYGYKLWVVTIRERSWVEEDEIRFPCRVAWLFPHDRERSSVI